MVHRRDGGRHAELRHFIGSRAGIVQEKKQRIITLSLCGVAIGRRKQGIHLGFFQIRDRVLGSSFKGNGLNLPTPFNVFWSPLADKMRQRMDRCKPLVACRHAAPAGLLQMLQELPHMFGSKMIDVKLIDVLWALPAIKGMSKAKESR